MRLGHRDVALWLFELEQKNINEFKHKDLPKELQLKKLILKARLSGLISKIEKDDKCAITWRITKEGHELAASYGSKEYEKIRK